MTVNAIDAVAREPLGRSGASGNRLERVTLRDGRTQVVKTVSAEWDWISRATGDDGRVVRMWERGLFDRIPPAIDHAMLDAEQDGDRWSVRMRDASSTLIAPGRRMRRAEVRRVLAAIADLHLAFWGERFPELCTLPDRYNLLAPAHARSEIARGAPGEHAGERILLAWEAFAQLAPGDVGATILALAEDPAPLVEALERCEPTLIHGDVRLNNLGLAEDGRVVLLDWGERTGGAPAAVELASFLVFDGRRFDVSRDDVIADFRALYGDRVDDRSMDLALVGGLVQLGCNLALPVALGRGEEAVAAARAELAWWVPRVAAALERTGL